MTVKNHIISVLPFGVFYYFLDRNLLFTVVAMFSGVVMDADHIIDYVITQKRIDSPKKMIRSFNTFEIVNKNFFLLHSWELVIFFGIILFFYRDSFLIAIFAGCTFHLLLDQIYNTSFLGKYNVKKFFYFFFYRMKYKFDVLPLRKEGARIKPEDKIYA